MRQLLPIDLSRRGAASIVGGINDSASAQLQPLTQGDTVTYALQGLMPYTTFPSPSVYFESPIQFSSIRLGIGLLDKSPSDGSFALKVGEDTTTTLPWNVAPEVMEQALNLLASVILLGGLTVRRGKATHFYLIRWNDSDVTDAVSVVENRLSPRCFPRVLAYEDSAENYQLLKLIQAPIAFTDQFARPNPPAIQIGEVRAGSSLRNEIQSIAIPADANGEFDLHFSGFATAAIAVAEVSEAAIQTALAELYADTVERFRVKELTVQFGRLFHVEFVGPLAKADQALLGFTMYSQVPLPYPEATLVVPPLPLDLVLEGAPSTALVLEIVVADAEGNEDTLAQRPITILNDMLDAAVAQDVAAIATRTDTVYITLNPEEDAVIIGQRGVQVNHPGYDDPEAVPSTANIAHGLGTLTPLIAVSELVSLAPDKWKTGHLSLNADSSDANSSTITIGFQPARPGEIGSVKFTIINPQAAPWVNTHEHPTSAIYRGEGEDRQTLDEILEEIVNAMPDGWPSVPASKISGTIGATQLDISGLAGQLKVSQAFLLALQSLVSDPTITDNLGTALQSSTKFAETLINLFATNTEVKNGLATSLSGNVSFVDTIRTLIASVMQGTAGALPTVVTWELRAWNTTFPPLLPDGSLPRLPAAVFLPPNLGTLVGLYVPRASSDNKGKRYTIGADGAVLPPKKRRTFRAGEVIYSTGDDWVAADVCTLGTFTVNVGTNVLAVDQPHFLAVADVVQFVTTGTLPAGLSLNTDYYVLTAPADATMTVSATAGGSVIDITDTGTGVHSMVTGVLYAKEFERELFTLEVNDQQFRKGTRFSLLYTFFASLVGNCEGRYLFTLLRGRPNASRVHDTNLSTITVEETVIRVPLTVTDALCRHTFGYAVERDEEGVMTATKQIYGETDIATVAPASPNFTLRGFLSRMDPENVDDPRGQFTIIAPQGQMASIVPLAEN